MMKNQLAGLMKQAQAMQENMKQAQEAIKGDWYAIYLEWQKLPHRHRTKH